MATTRLPWTLQGLRGLPAVNIDKDRRRPGSGSDAKDLGLTLGVVNAFLKTPSRMKLPPVDSEAQERP